MSPITHIAITPEMLAQARLSAQTEGRMLVEVLEQLHGGETDDFVSALGHAVGRPVLTMAQLRHLTPAFDVLPLKECTAHDCVLLHGEQGGLLLVHDDPFDASILAWADLRIEPAYTVCLAHRSDIAAWLAAHEDGLRAMDGALAQDENAANQAGNVEELSFRGIAQDASPVVRLVNSTLFDALRTHASDIHLETTSAGMSIRYRLDGVLSTVGSVASVQMAEQMISRIKVMSELDIAERRVPQDGRFRVSVGGREVDLRVSIMPSMHGEDAVLRVLDKQQLSDQAKGLQLTGLGFDEPTAKVLRRLASLPYGMFLVTGPTGSGKTTTLYAAISEINHGHDKIVTIEDPVEYQLPGVLQIPVNERKGLTFAKGLRSILRHDPDKIMVGEIRDPETAQIAIQSALTGHLVFTSVHANNVFDVLGRFSHMGIDPYAFMAALNGIVAQRLIRVICPQCGEDHEPDESLLAESGLAQVDVSGFRFRVGRGCGHCRGTGYRGRKAIAEILHLTDAIRELIVGRAPVSRIKEAAVAGGTQFLRGAAIDLVRSGETTLMEVNRVTFAD